MKLNITPGPWIIDGVFLGLQTKQNYPHDLLIVADTRPDTEFDTPFTFEQAQNATAIVTAVNNTYHKGINPEAVPEMLTIITGITMLSSEGKVPDSVIQAAKTILQKATLCLTTS